MKIFGFDYDGTIINIEPQKAAAFGSLLSTEWGVNKDEASQFWLQHGGTSRRHKFDHFYTKRFDKNLPDEVYHQIESDFSQLLKKKYYPDIRLLSHAQDVLAFIRSHFDYTFVSSGVPDEEIKYLVELNQLTKYFNRIYGTSKEYLSKRDHFKTILKNKKPTILIYMADSVEDMKIAREFGAISIGLPTNQSPEVLKNAGATYVSELRDVISLLNKLLQNK